MDPFPNFFRGSSGMTSSGPHTQNPVLDDGGCAAHEPYALRVLGDSMEPEFADGCIIIVDPAGYVQGGSYVVARVEGEPIFRQYWLESDRHWLRPLNPGYPNLEIRDISSIIGVITQRSGTHRSYRRHYV